MAVTRTFYMTRADGVNLYRHYSDAGKMLKQNETGIEYAEAIDVENAPFTYSETNIPVPEDEEEATTEDYEAALAELGVK